MVNSDDVNEKTSQSRSSGADDEWELDLQPLEPVDIVHNNGYQHEDGRTDEQNEILISFSQ